MAALRSFLKQILAPDVEIVRGQANRVAEPRGDDYVVMTPTLRRLLRTGISTYYDPVPHNLPGRGERRVCAGRELTIQIDVHGPRSADNAELISTLLRDFYACDAFAATGFDVQPLYADEPRETPFINENQQYEYRWTIEAVLQVNAVAALPQDFADTLKLNVVNVERVFPPDAPRPGPVLSTIARAVAGSIAPAFVEPGAASLQWTGGAVVEDGVEFLIPSAPYPLLLTRLDYEVGTAGGSFLATVTVDDAPIGGLNVLVNAQAQSRAVPTSDAQVAANSRVACVVSDTNGQPTNAVLTLHFTH